LIAPGRVLTAAHLVRCGSRLRVRVVGAPGWRPAKVVALNDQADLAVLSYPVRGRDDVEPAALAEQAPPNGAVVWAYEPNRGRVYGLLRARWDHALEGHLAVGPSGRGAAVRNEAGEVFAVVGFVAIEGGSGEFDALGPAVVRRLADRAGDAEPMDRDALCADDRVDWSSVLAATRVRRPSVASAMILQRAGNAAKSPWLRQRFLQASSLHAMLGGDVDAALELSQRLLEVRRDWTVLRTSLLASFVRTGDPRALLDELPAPGSAEAGGWPDGTLDAAHCWSTYLAGASTAEGGFCQRAYDSDIRTPVIAYATALESLAWDAWDDAATIAFTPHPDDPLVPVRKWHILRGRIWFARGQMERALEALGPRLRSDSKPIRAEQQLIAALSLSALGRHDEAYEAIVVSMSALPGWATSMEVADELRDGRQVVWTELGAYEWRPRSP